MNNQNHIQTEKSINISIFLVSFIILFFELALIRFISTEARIFAYLTNLILLSCFIGISAGCYRSDKNINLSLTFLLTTILVVLIYIPLYVEIEGYKFHIFRNLPDFLASWENTVIHTQYSVLHLHWIQIFSSLATLVMFFCILFAMVPLGQLMGYRMNQHQYPIKAYSINIAASLLGVWAFSAMSFLYAPAWVWLLISATLLLILIISEKRNARRACVIFLACCIVSGIFFIERSNKEKHGLTIWSPYQKVTMRPIIPFLPEEQQIDPFKQKSSTGYYLDVNGHNFTNILNLSTVFQQEHKDLFKDNSLYFQQGDDFVNRYNFPYRFKPNADSILILGSGAGNDTASAVRYGYKNIDAVEIDPGIVKLADQYHPENPYRQPGVHLVVDDARSFLKKAVREGRRYDLIYFALLDAHSQSGTMASMRMDHYVYTEESFQDVKKILKPDGVLIVTFWVQRIWIGQRIAEMMEKTFGWEPYIVKYDGNKQGLGPVAVVGANNPDNVKTIIKNNTELNDFFTKHFVRYNLKVSTTTDDWPFFYLRSRQIPSMYILVIALISAMLLFMRFAFWKKGERIDWHFFFLGAAFLLLEFQNINKTALLYGSTWIVNAVNISAILIMILLANLLLIRWPIRRISLVYSGLFISLILIFVIPLSFFSSLSFWPKFILSSVVLNLPIFFAGIIFSSSFQKCPHKNIALGSNFLGAVLGGMLESVAFLTGIRMLVLVTLFLYALSLVAYSRKS
ncbi:MAG: hypothetical protein KBD53_06385 [Candidatus Omnitrophica bacterium]|nr:hypothetical protein [Candidatus Omnitrophota bacterium]